MKERNGLSVVVCTYERHALLKDTLICLLTQSLAGLDGYEIIVVDNSANHNSAKVAADGYRNDPAINYVIADIPGLSHARNIGLKTSRYPIVAYVDDDVIVPEHWAETVMAAFATTSRKTAAVGGKVLLAMPFPAPGWLHPSLLGYLGHFDRGAKMITLKKGSGIIGCNMAFDRQALLSVGGFDEELGRRGGAENLLSNEELKVTRALQKLGREIIYAPAAVLQHIVHPSRLSKDWFRQRFRWQAVSDGKMGGPELTFRHRRAVIRCFFHRCFDHFPVIRKWQSEAQIFHAEVENLYDQTLLNFVRKS